ncbi:MAG: hypothetical protein Q8M64_02765 [Methyloversatilis sp.]|nr:hypothetical protein [Methyloversatilis sp.]
MMPRGRSASRKQILVSPDQPAQPLLKPDRSATVKSNWKTLAESPRHRLIATAHKDNANMMSEKASEQTYVALLQNWIASLRKRFKLSPSWMAAIDKLERRLAERPQSVTALDVGRLFQPLEKHRAVTEHTPRADRALQYLIESGRLGEIENASDELYAWFRKHYLWATGSLSINVSELNTHTSDEAIRQYFNVG